MLREGSAATLHENWRGTGADRVFVEELLRAGAGRNPVTQSLGDEVTTFGMEITPEGVWNEQNANSLSKWRILVFGQCSAGDGRRTHDHDGGQEGCG